MSTSFQGVFGTYLYVIKCSPVCSSLSCVFWEYYSAQLTVNCSTHFRPWISKKHVLRFNNNHATTSAYVRKNTNYYNCKGSYVDGKQENHYWPFPLKHSFPIGIILLSKLNIKTISKKIAQKENHAFDNSLKIRFLFVLGIHGYLICKQYIKSSSSASKDPLEKRDIICRHGRYFTQTS